MKDDLLPEEHVLASPLPEALRKIYDNDAVIMIHRLVGNDCDDIVAALGLRSVKVEPKSPLKN